MSDFDGPVGNHGGRAHVGKKNQGSLRRALLAQIDSGGADPYFNLVNPFMNARLLVDARRVTL